MKKLSIRKFMDSLGFPLALAAFANSTSGFNATLEWILAGLTGLMAIILLFENISGASPWRSIVEWIESHDFGYVVFGIGLMSGGSAITNNPWGIILFLIAGAGFVAVGIARMNSIQMERIANRSPKIAVGIGVLILISSCIVAIVNWSNISIDFQGVRTLQVFWLIGMGLAYMFAGIITSKRQYSKKII